MQTESCQEKSCALSEAAKLHWLNLHLENCIAKKFMLSSSTDAAR